MPQPNPLKILLLGGAAFAAYKLFRTARAGKQLTFAISKVRTTCAGSLPGMPCVQIDVLVRNPTAETFEVSNLVANITANGVFVADAAGMNPITIQPQSEIPIPLKLSLSLGNAVFAFITAIKTGTVAQEIKIKGSVMVNGIQVPIDLNYSWKP